MIGESIIHAAGAPRVGPPVDADPITTEVLRHALNSAANQMKRALIRTAFSPVIYEVLDFAVAIYDREVRLLAQAPSMPHFMGRLSYCVSGAVSAVGGEHVLEAGDILLYNSPYGTGSHPQDLVTVMPVFLEAELIGYTAVNVHWLDIAGKDPYSTDTVDVFQEGKVYPGVRIYRRGERVDDVYRIVMANTRVPKALKGDLDAQITGCRIGATGFEAVVRRFGLDTFRRSTEHMFDHGERLVRSYFEKIPDGSYSAEGRLDNNGVSDAPVPFTVKVEVAGSDVLLDFSESPPQQSGPFNTPLPSTMSISRVAITMLAGFGEAPNEGHFRPIRVKTRPGTMFHALSPAPCFLYAWPALQAIEVIYEAFSKAVEGVVPAWSGGCICSVVYWGTRTSTGDPWADGAPHPVGQGAWQSGDGSTVMHIAQSATRLSPVEVWESRNPWLVEKMELAADSGGPGTFRGGAGLDLHIRMLEDTFITPVVERTKTPPRGLAGGGAGRANNAAVRFADGRYDFVPKATRYLVPRDGVLELMTGGGGGYGPSAGRDPEAVASDLREGYISKDFALRNYPHAL